MSRSEPGTRGWPPTFDGGIWPAVAFVLAFTVWLIISNSLLVELLGPDPAVVPERMLGVVSSTVQITIAVLVLRYEGVGLDELGLSPRLLAPAVVAVVGVVVAFNAIVAAFVVLGGGELSVRLFALYRSPPRDLSLSAIVASGVYYYLFVGPAEELAFRGYLQNKLTALLGDGNDRLRVGVGVVGAAVVFSLLHVPTLLIVGDARIGGVVGLLVLLTLSGITFGTVYALTRNLYLVAFLHGIGDFWPLFVDPGPVAWPNYGVVVACYAVLVVVYRRWATGTARSTIGVPEPNR